MGAWWASLDLLLKILYCVTVPATVILLLQTVLLLLGFGHGGAGIDSSDVSGLGGDADFSGDLHTDFDGADLHADLQAEHPAGHDGSIDGGNPADLPTMHLFTLQTVIAFLTVFGWTSIVSISSGAQAWSAMVIGALLGLLAMVLIAKLVQLSGKLAENGTRDLHNALGRSARVYLPIPPEGAGQGKVTLTLQGSFTECDAMQTGKETLAVGTDVRVIDLRGDLLIVEKE